MPLAPVPGSMPDFRFVNASGEASPYTKAMAKHQIKLGDPAFEPHNARRNIMTDRNGAGYTVPIGVAPMVAPETGATLAMGRLLPPSVNRSSPFEFESGIVDHS